MAFKDHIQEPCQTAEPPKQEHVGMRKCRLFSDRQTADVTGGDAALSGLLHALPKPDPNSDSAVTIASQASVLKSVIWDPTNTFLLCMSWESEMLIQTTWGLQHTATQHCAVTGVKHTDGKRLPAQRLEQRDEVCRAKQWGGHEKYSKIQPGNILHINLLLFLFFPYLFYF